MAVRTRGRIAIALSTLGLAWPVLDILGQNAEFFIARGSSRGEVTLVLALLAVGVPAVAALPAIVPGRLGWWVGMVWLGMLAIALAFLIVHSLDWPAPAAWAAFAGVALLVAIGRFESLRAVLLLLSWSPLVLAAYFLFATPSGSMILDKGVPVAGTVEPASAPPIVLLVFDEFPISSLIDPAGNLRADRYPNFARLAAEGIWYRNAVTVQQQTEHSVPAILTGVNPEQSLNPFAGQYPGSLFTALSAAYELEVEETMTQMCPVTVCAPGPERVGRGPLFEDLGVIAGHLLLPSALTDSLPPIDRNWGNFGAATEDFDAIESFNDARRGGDPRRTLDDLARRLQEADPEVPTFFFAHALLPHNPWQYLPTGQRYPIDSERLPGSNQTGWGDNAWLAAQALQRHLLQVQYVDAVLGKIIAAMEANGIYDQAVVIVVADHGIALRPNIEHWRRIESDTVGAVAAIPLFVKLPGSEQAGTIDDRRALTIDIVPTIADILEVETPWQIDGVSLVGPDPQRSKTTTVGPVSEATFGVDGAEKLAVAADNAAWFPTGDPYELLPTGAPDLVGLPSTAIEDVRSDVSIRLDHPDWYTDVDPTADLVPARLTGTVSGLASDEEALLAIAVNGRVVAVVLSFHDRGRSGFQAMLPLGSLRAGENAIEVIPLAG